MNSLTDELRRLREQEPDVALILDTFEEIERVYRDTLEAMGVTGKHTLEAKNSAEVTISFRPVASSSSD